jgi:GH15 family glucan-1,4-alpha-glucosidase
MQAAGRYRPIGDHALIGDCHTTALVSSDGSIEWCCLPRFDSPSVFGRILDHERGGACEIRPVGQVETSRRYVDGTMILETTFRDDVGEVRLLDCFSMRRGGREEPRRELLRVVEGVRGRMDLQVRVAPRFDYGLTSPWIRAAGDERFTAVGGSTGLVIRSDMGLVLDGTNDLHGTVTVGMGDRRFLSFRFARPEDVDALDAPGPVEVEVHLRETEAWWRRWVDKASPGTPPDAIRSALALKTMTSARTGGMIAAATTSLPEAPGGVRNWDYRFCWIRDASFVVRSLEEIGFHEEAEGFARFVQRTTAGSVRELQVLYGVGGERLLPETELEWLEGYDGAAPVRIGNGAATQLQLDIFGELVDVAWEWHRRGRSPDEPYLHFLFGVVDEIADRWREPDRGIWEVRSEPVHFVHSKVMCWVALDRGIRFAELSGRDLPVERWRHEREEVRRAIESRGFDEDRGVFVRAFEHRDLDAALLLLPAYGFVAYDDDRMRRTVDTIREELTEDGFVLRYRAEDGLPGHEGTFLACTFWLAECLARQGRLDEAREVYDRALTASNDLGLFPEEFEPVTATMLGNFPQGLTHLAHIEACVALREAGSSGQAR